MGMDIDTLEAGPGLDALVAEKVMGWVKHFPLQLTEDSPPDFDYSWFSDAKGRLAEVPEYSTDIAAAWEVVEKFGLMIIPVTDPHGKRVGWAATIEEVEQDEVQPDSGHWFEAGTSTWTFGETAPLAICLAALKAVGA